MEYFSSWSEIKVECTDYVIKIGQHHSAEQLTCWLSDFTSLWSETLTFDILFKRYKECNPLLDLNPLKQLIVMKYTTQPENANNLLIEQKDSILELRTKNYINDGTDDISLKFQWSLKKVSDQAVYETFTGEVLKYVVDLQKIKELETTYSFDHYNHPLLHQVFSCDNCDQGIFGTRYNCLDCRDFDLCGNCIEKVEHKHLMVRYAQPEDERRFKRSYRCSNVLNVKKPKLASGGEGEYLTE